MNYEKMIENQFKVLKALKGKSHKSLFFQGERGIGKTQLIKDFCKNNGLELFILNLSCIESSDFTGIPHIVENKTIYAMPEFFTMKKGILFLDEINRVNDNDVKTGLLSLLQDRGINGHKLSNDVLIVTAGNTNNEDYDVNEFDKALTDRLINVPFKRSFKDFLEYLENTKGRSSLLDFYKIHGENLKEYSHRTLEYTLDYVSITNDHDMIVNYLSASIYALFMEYLSKNLYSFDDLINGELKKGVDVSSEKKLILDLHDALKNDFQFTDGQAKNVNKFLNSIKAENKMLFFQELQKLAFNDQNFDHKKASWKKLDLFKGLKQYLDSYLS